MYVIDHMRESVTRVRTVLVLINLARHISTRNSSQAKFQINYVCWGPFGVNTHERKARPVLAASTNPTGRSEAMTDANLTF